MSAAATSLSSEEQIDAELDALSRHLAGLHQNLKDRPAMKYALESLPELIGKQQFRQLVVALGLDEEMISVEKNKATDVGEWFAGAVTHKASAIDRRRREEARRSSEDFAQRFQVALAKPCEPSPEVGQPPVQQASPVDSLQSQCRS